MQNPFLNDDFHIQWSTLTPDHVEDDIALALENAQNSLKQLVSQPLDALTYDSTLLAFEEMNEKFGEAWNKVSHLDAVCDSPELRKAYNAMLPKVSEFNTRLYLNDDLWKLIKSYSETDDAKALTDTRKRLLEETIADFTQSGADLPADKKQELAEVNAELAKVTQKYSENVLDSTNEWEMIIDDEAKLDGLPDSAKEAARESALKKDHGTEEAPKWRFTLQMPSLVPVLTYLKNREIRKQVWEASNQIASKGEKDNSQLIWQILELRHRKAKLLGKDHFADHTTARRMAGSGQAALDFVQNLNVKVRDAFRKDVEEMREFSGFGEDLEPWDVGIVCENMRKASYAFDEEDLRPYFPIDSVMKGMFDLAERIFGLKIEEKEGVDVWHEEVKFYDLMDADTGKHLGSFYADWHPRETKRGGAWMNNLRTGGPLPDGSFVPHLGLICGNLTPSIGGKPALLTHREVETIFHEFGHLIHHLCGEVDVRTLNGIHVVWDFVELPSQIMENWCWERESLDLFARHYETGDAIPDELLNKMKAARTFQSSFAMIRQLYFGKMDLELHLNYETHVAHKEENIDVYIRSFMDDYTMDFKSGLPSMARRFGHLFSSSTGYAAGYYSYKWAEVLDADAFSKFQEEGILNPDTGRKYRECIISKGNSKPAGELYRDFMGRDPDPDALLRRDGLLS